MGVDLTSILHPQSGFFTNQVATARCLLATGGPSGVFAARQREAKTACRYQNHGQDPAKTAWFTNSRHGGGGYGGSGVVGFWKLLGRLQLLSQKKHDANREFDETFLCRKMFCLLLVLLVIGIRKNFFTEK